MPYTDHIAADDIDRLVGDHAGPCVSIYLPTSVITEDTDKDRIRLKNLRSEAFDQLTGRGLRRPDAEAILLPVDDLLEDDSFWPYLSDGLAIFASPEMHALYRVPMAPPPGVRVGDRFHLKPLLPLLTEDGVFHIVAVSQSEVRLLEGTRHHVTPVEIGGAPGNMADALRRRGRDPDRAPLRRWQGDEGKAAVPSVLHAGRSRAPAGVRQTWRAAGVRGVDYLFPIYREATAYRYLVDQPISGNPDQMTASELHARAWPIVAPVFARPRQEALQAYRSLQGSGRTSTDLETILGAALDGRVDTLFVELSAEVFGAFDPTRRTMTVHGEPQPGDRDLAAQAARWAFGTGARIFAGEPPEIPEGGPLAAIFRYA